MSNYDFVKELEGMTEGDRISTIKINGLITHGCLECTVRIRHKGGFELGDEVLNANLYHLFNSCQGDYLCLEDKDGNEIGEVLVESVDGHLEIFDVEMELCK